MNEITKKATNKLKEYPCCIWFTGLSGSGKSSIAKSLQIELKKVDINSSILDGDILRLGLCSDLTFSINDRKENIRRVSEVAKLFVEAGLTVIVTLITPFQQDRSIVREKFNSKQFIEIYLSTPVEICEKRDPKGLYKKARDGKLTDFTGISSPFEPSTSADLIFNTDKVNIKEIVGLIIKKIYGQKCSIL